MTGFSRSSINALADSSAHHASVSFTFPCVARYTNNLCRSRTKVGSCPLKTLTFLNVRLLTLQCPEASCSYGSVFISSGCERVPSAPFLPSSQPTTAARARICTRHPGGLDRLSKIFTTVNFDLSATAGPPSPRSGKLEAEAVTREGAYSEDSVIKGGASSEPSVLTVVSVSLALCKLSVSTEPVSCPATV